MMTDALEVLVLKRKLLALGVLGALLIALSLAVYLPAQGREARTVRVAMGYIPNVQFAPWYVAEAKGYFAREGLKLDLDYSMDVDGLLLLGQGKKDFAVGGGDMVLIGRSQGLPITYVCTLYAKFPPSIVALEAKGIKTLADLRGKRIGVPYMGTSYIALRAMLAKAGLTESDVRVLMIGYTQIPALLADKIDAAVVFANNEPLQLAAQKQKFTQLYSYDYFPLVGHGVVAGERLLKEDPALVRAFVRATLEGDGLHPPPPGGRLQARTESHRPAAGGRGRPVPGPPGLAQALGERLHQTARAGQFRPEGLGRVAAVHAGERFHQERDRGGKGDE